MSIIDMPVRSSPAKMAAGIGEAPRQRGSRDGWTFSTPRAGISKTFFRRISPYATTIITSGESRVRLSRKSGSRRVAGWSTGKPIACAAIFTGDALGARLRRPDGRSGCVITATILWPSFASLSSEGIAKAGVPRKTIDITTPTSQ